MSYISEKETIYIEWQNLALRFYIPSRLLYAKALHSAAAFCAQQCLESMLKATLLYWVKDFVPRTAGHKLESMLVRLEENVLGANKEIIPRYFYHEGMYQTDSRYPEGSIAIPASFLADLDRAFVDLVLLVPCQFNSILLHTLLPKKDSYKNHLSILSKDNLEMDRLKKHVLTAYGADYYIREYERMQAIVKD